MGYPDNILRITWGGSIQGGDIWSNSVHCKIDGLLGNPPLGDQAAEADAFVKNAPLDEIFTKVAAWLAPDSGAGMATFYSLDYIQIVRLLPLGKQATDPNVYVADQKVTTKTASGTYRTYQDSCVISLLANGRGRGTKGRIYPPAQEFTLDGQGRINQGQLDTSLSNFKSVLKKIESFDHNGAPSIGDAGEHLTVIVAGKIGAGSQKSVETLQIGNVFDTQRRRRNRLRESYVVTTKD